MFHFFEEAAGIVELAPAPGDQLLLILRVEGLLSSASTDSRGGGLLNGGPDLFQSSLEVVLSQLVPFGAHGKCVAVKSSVYRLGAREEAVVVL